MYVHTYIVTIQSIGFKCYWVTTSCAQTGSAGPNKWHPAALELL